MSTVNLPAASVKPARSGNGTAKTPKAAKSPAKAPAKSSPAKLSPAALAAAWAALGRVAGKEGNRADLPAGSSYTANLAVLGEVDGETVSMEFMADVTVGHDSVRASSSTPDANHLIACILAKLNKTSRAKILRELPEDFAREGNTLPAVEESLIDAAGNMLERLRAKVEQPVKGSVSCRYRLIEADAR